jgi:hypothetical protein
MFACQVCAAPPEPIPGGNPVVVRRLRSADRADPDAMAGVF